MNNHLIINAKNQWENRYSAIIVLGIILLLLYLLARLILTGVESALSPGTATLPAVPIWKDSIESVSFTVGVIVFAVILALIPALLYFSLAMGSKRERIKGDLWADIQRMGMTKYLAESAKFEYLVKRNPNNNLTFSKEQLEQLAARQFDRHFQDSYGGGAFSIPIVLYLVLCFFGWMLIFFPTMISGGDLVPIRGGNFYSFPAMIQGGPVAYFQAIAEKASLFSFAFLGAYFWSLQNLARRYLASDLKPASYTMAAIQIVSGWSAALLFLVALPDSWVIPNATWWTPAFGFFLGIFTLPIIMKLWEMTKKPIPSELPRLYEEGELTQLKGLNFFNENRLSEENIENIHALTTVNLLNLLTNIRYPTETVLGWIDQALLYSHADDDLVQQLRQFGILTASDLIDVWCNSKRKCKDKNNKNANNGLLTRDELLSAMEDVTQQNGSAKELVEAKLKGTITSLWRAPNFGYVYAYWQEVNTQFAPSAPKVPETEARGQS